ncbi:MAG TPA: GTPase Era [Terriglobia bacterium]|nr:GTPase Era [Terriglobia bacterium]
MAKVRTTADESRILIADSQGPAPDSPLPTPDSLSSHKSGFVAIVGRPNAGKSTLINALVGMKVSIVTPVPQTTRNRILGIANRPGAQIIFMDTPGIHKPLSGLNRQMMEFVRQALQERDLALLIVDAAEKFGKGDQFAIELLRQYSPTTILALNKIDKIHKPRLLPLIDRYSKLYDFAEIIPISAKSGAGLDELLTAVVKLLPEGPQYFPPDVYTDQPERFLAAEIIREKIISHTRQEMPYVTAVLIDQFEETPTLTRISATVVVEKESQKPIVIGAGGERLKQIGTEARLELEKLLPPKVFLELYVKVEPQWRDNRTVVAELDYRNEAGEWSGADSEAGSQESGVGSEESEGDVNCE